MAGPDGQGGGGGDRSTGRGTLRPYVEPAAALVELTPDEQELLGRYRAVKDLPPEQRRRDPRREAQRQAQERVNARRRNAVLMIDLVYGTGLSIAAASEQIGVPKSTGRNLLDYGISLEAEAAREGGRPAERAKVRLQRLIRALWPDAVNRDVAAVREVRFLQHQLNRLEGSYPPPELHLHLPQSDPVDPDAASTWAKLEELRRLRDAARDVVVPGVSAPPAIDVESSVVEHGPNGDGPATAAGPV